MIAWRDAMIPKKIGARSVNGLQVHAINRHLTEVEWAMAQNAKQLAYEHSVYHANGGQHKT